LAGEDQETGQHHRHGIQRVDQKGHKALDEGDLQQHEGQPQGTEIGEYAAPTAARQASPRQPQGQQDQHRAGQQGLGQRRGREQRDGQVRRPLGRIPCHRSPLIPSPKSSALTLGIALSAERLGRVLSM